MKELSANITELCFDYLDAPPVVVGSKNWITPAFELEKYFFPQADWIIDALHSKIMPIAGYVTSSNATVTEIAKIDEAKRGV
jgi:2-oxoisovalerate dehydrogenase E1 component